MLDPNRHLQSRHWAELAAIRDAIALVLTNTWGLATETPLQQLLTRATALNAPEDQENPSLVQYEVIEDAHAMCWDDAVSVEPAGKRMRLPNPKYADDATLGKSAEDRFVGTFVGGRHVEADHGPPLPTPLVADHNVILREYLTTGKVSEDSANKLKRCIPGCDGGIIPGIANKNIEGSTGGLASVDGNTGLRERVQKVSCCRCIC